MLPAPSKTGLRAKVIASMNNVEPSEIFYIGWDVGAWSCDKNRKSRDAIVVLDQDRCQVGKTWHGNLRVIIEAGAEAAESAGEFAKRLLGACDVTSSASHIRCVLAIDAPLGFPIAFQNLIVGGEAVTTPSKGKRSKERKSIDNRYLFRKTEQLLTKRPLSAIQDMIGSQATKAMHTLACFNLRRVECGVWADIARTVMAIETYPSPCYSSEIVRKYLPANLQPDGKSPKGLTKDVSDAYVCALVASFFGETLNPSERYGFLEGPGSDIPCSEGWIWLPKDIPQRPQEAAKTAWPD